ncbi:MAG: plasma membrane localization protein [Ramalina farinacea]|uniref:Plasma membrane localization protein n=1 Tax=Ramalina farinacea TaxID=258253 RepID=A0AA43TSL2_9LECA|nr:plasma membrane localization protein [Ramalina farinacea]
MNAVRQRCRPKHQVLILKCYPRFQKNVQEVKPNPSELSYLLYYTSSRRSKLQKVGAFLERKAASDVAKNRLGNTQVTLQILKALIEKLPRDLPLYAIYLLRIIGSVLRSKDLPMVEESIPLFETFCQNYDVATLAADQELIGQYEEIVRTYASYAALKTPVQPKGGLNAPTAIRWRSAGLRALKSITASEDVGADGGRQMNIIMPVILQNLHSGDEASLMALQQRAQAQEGEQKEQATRRRMSIATVRTNEEKSRPSSATVAGITTDDADRLAEEEVGLLAFQSLKQILVANNRAQVRLATSALLKSKLLGTWTTKLVEMVTTWAPVQDRFIILVTIMETLVKSPIAEENLEQQLMLLSLVDWLLKSSINMIGLSVMDVLLGLIQHILLLLQLGGKGSSVLPHHQQTDAIDLFQGAEALMNGADKHRDKSGMNSDEAMPSSNRQELLTRLHKCIGDLATHIYYSDQISDMISAILLRLKPSPHSAVSSTAAAIEHPVAAAKAISDSVQLQENPATDSFFSFGTARVTALKAIKDILIVANPRGTATGAAALGRNRVGVQVWEGTQWLLRDEDRRVRRAYVDALLTWLELEMNSKDLVVFEDKRRLLRSASKNDIHSLKSGSMTKRAVSNATARDTIKPENTSKSTFLQLLHLAIFDNAIDCPESESDLLLLHLLLCKLIDKLGVNAVQTGLPMILRLQEDINVDLMIPTPVGKMNVGCLVHGYLWALTEKFDFDASTVGYVVQSEIQRRKKHGLWIDTVQIPPVPLEQTISSSKGQMRLNLDAIQKESLKPFDSRAAIVDRIAEAYGKTVTSPPTSPPSSPGRIFSMPILAGGGPSIEQTNELPPRIKETMMSDWSKEICIASVEKSTSIKTTSLYGSRKGKHLSQLLGVNGVDVSPNREPSPARGILPSDNNIANQPGNALNFAFNNKHRDSSAKDTESATPSSTGQATTVTVEELKRILKGGRSRTASPLRHATDLQDHDVATSSQARIGPRHDESGDDASEGESIMSGDVDGFESASEGDLSQPLPAPIPNSIPAAASSSTTTAAPTAATTTNTIPSTSPSQPYRPHSTQTTHTTSTTASASHPHSHTHSRNASLGGTGPRSRPHSGSHSDHGPSTPRSLRRPSTSSSAAGEDPEANAAALRGEIVSTSRLSMDGSAIHPDVPPVPPLPKGVQGRPLSGVSHGGKEPLESAAASIGLPREKEREREMRPPPLPADAGAAGDGVKRGKSKRSNAGGSKDSSSTPHSNSNNNGGDDDEGGRVRSVDIDKLLGSIDAITHKAPRKSSRLWENKGVGFGSRGTSIRGERSRLTSSSAAGPVIGAAGEKDGGRHSDFGSIFEGLDNTDANSGGDASGLRLTGEK